MKQRNLIHTYSIIAADPVSGLMGGAVQSHYFSVGGTVIWAEAGTGVVATQAMVNMDYGPQGLELLRRRISAAEVMKTLTQDDETPEIRQAAVLDCNGGVSAHTGLKTIREAGHLTGEKYSVQANMMLGEKVPEAMAEAYESSSGDFAQRLLGALLAAEKAGGDIRGMQSSAILIVPIYDRGNVRENIVADLRVEDHPEPLEELGRLLSIHEAYRHADLGDLAVEKGDIQQAMTEYDSAEKLQPDNTELKFWKAVSLMNNGLYDDAAAVFGGIAHDGNWLELLSRLPAAGITGQDEKTRAFIEKLR